MRITLRDAYSLILSVTACVCAISGTAHAETLYVDANAGECSDSSSRSENSAQTPWCSIQKAAEDALPGDEVVVADGVYGSNDSQFGVVVRASGSDGAPITFRAENRWGARIEGPVPESSSGSTYCINFAPGRSHVRIEGFDLSGCTTGLNINNENHHIEVVRNHIHDIGRRVTDSSYGQSAISFGGDSTHLRVDGNYIHTIGRLEGSTHPYNHDHGIYIRSTDVEVVNNVFADHRAGWAIHIYDNNRWKERLRIINNTFLDPNPNRDGHIIITDRTREVLIANNIFRGPRNAAVRNKDCDERSDINVRDNLTDVDAMIHGQRCDLVVEDNLTEVDPDLAEGSSGQWSPQPGSPAIDAADASIAPAHDFLEVQRPQGAGVDLGALEMVRETGDSDAGHGSDAGADGGSPGEDAGTTGADADASGSDTGSDASVDASGDTDGEQASKTHQSLRGSCSTARQHTAGRGAAGWMLALVGGCVLARRRRQYVRG